MKVQRFLVGFVGVTGAAVTAIEITAARLLAPYYGASLFVWANVIGVVLAGLALGYWFGGRLADRSPRATRLFAIVLAAGTFAGLVPIFTVIIVALSVRAFLHFDFALIVASLVSSVLLFGIPIFLLGMVSPFAIRLSSRGQAHEGRTAGTMFAAGTVGSIVGVFGSALVTIPLWGANETMVLASVMLIFVSLFGYALEAKKISLRALALFVPLFVLLFLYEGFWHDAQVLAERDSAYEHLRVIENDGTRYLIINSSAAVQSVYNPERVETGMYYDYFPLIVGLLDHSPDQTFILGLAGGTISRELLHYFPSLAGTITGVEIDPEIIKLANEFFGLGTQNITVKEGDARVVLKNLGQADIIFMDLFNQQLSIPVHLATEEFFKETRTHLADDGILAANVVAENRDSPLLIQFLSTLHTAYPHVYLFHIPTSFNFLVLASNKPLEFDRLAELDDDTLRPRAEELRLGVEEIASPQGRVFTDNWSNIDLLTDRTFFKILTQLRQ